MKLDKLQCNLLTNYLKFLNFKNTPNETSVVNKNVAGRDGAWFDHLP